MESKNHQIDEKKTELEAILYLTSDSLEWIETINWENQLYYSLNQTTMLGNVILCTKYKEKKLLNDLQKLINTDNLNQSLLLFCICIVEHGAFQNDDRLVESAGKILSKIYPLLSKKDKLFLIYRIDQMINYCGSEMDQIKIRRQGGALAFTILKSLVDNVLKNNKKDFLLFHHYIYKWIDDLTNKEYHYVIERGKQIKELFKNQN